MNLYLLKQNTNTGYDTFDACIVAAQSEQEAKQITPINETFGQTGGSAVGWCDSVDKVHCTYIGSATFGTPKGVILASFNSGTGEIKL